VFDEVSYLTLEQNLSSYIPKKISGHQSFSTSYKIFKIIMCCEVGLWVDGWIDG
jgi:hypothetical protein